MGDREKLNQLKIQKTELTENSHPQFPSVDGISVLAIVKKLKNGCHFANIDHTEEF